MTPTTTIDTDLLAKAAKQQREIQQPIVQQCIWTQVDHSLRERGRGCCSGCVSVTQWVQEACERSMQYKWGWLS